MSGAPSSNNPKHYGPMPGLRSRSSPGGSGGAPAETAARAVLEEEKRKMWPRTLLAEMDKSQPTGALGGGL